MLNANSLAGRPASVKAVLVTFPPVANNQHKPSNGLLATPYTSVSYSGYLSPCRKPNESDNFLMSIRGRVTGGEGSCPPTHERYCARFHLHFSLC